MNNLVRNNRLPEPGKGRKLASEYKKHIQEYWDTKIVAKLKQEKTRAQKQEFFAEWIEGVDFDTIANIIDFMAYVTKAKSIILSKISQGLESMATFVATDNGYEVTSGEGFVISDKTSGNTWKIVDRLEFSKLNFANSSAKFGQRSN